jgi:transposase-like protein
MADLKEVYRAATKDLAEQQLDALDKKWGKKYPLVINSWRNNWPKLSTYFKYDPAIRKMIYTTNTIEGFHRQVRKVTKTKGALLKLIYLAYCNIQKKWTAPLQNWAMTVSQLSIWFEGRIKLSL